MLIKRFELVEREALIAFLRVAYPTSPRQSHPRFWEWHFLENPFVNHDRIPVWIAKNAEQIVGQLAAIPVELKVGMQYVQAIWILDLVVLPEYRGRGLAKRLVLAAEEFCPIRLGVNTNEQHAPSLLKSLGWVIVGKISRYNRLLFPGDVVREISQISPVRRLANFCYGPFRSGLDPLPSTGPYSIRNVERFDSSFDILWQECSAQWTCAVVRSSQMLTWQYEKQPWKEFDVLGFYEDDKLLGYVVIFFRQKESDGTLRKASITDLSYHPTRATEIIDGLLQQALSIAIKRRVGSVVMDVVDPLVEKRLKRFRFWRIKSPLQLMVKSAADQDLLYNSSTWFLTRGDSDISIFENPNLVS